jgi:hypothetical protein
MANVLVLCQANRPKVTEKLKNIAISLLNVKIENINMEFMSIPTSQGGKVNYFGSFDNNPDLAPFINSHKSYYSLIIMNTCPLLLFGPPVNRYGLDIFNPIIVERLKTILVKDGYIAITALSDNTEMSLDINNQHREKFGKKLFIKEKKENISNPFFTTFKFIDHSILGVIFIFQVKNKESNEKILNMQLNVKKKDFLILSYNEGAEDFMIENLNNPILKNRYDEVILKIMTEEPAFLFVCTQESKSSGNTHYQNLLSNMLDQIPNNPYKKLLKIDGSVITPASMFTTNKNVRTRIYYNNNRVLNNILTKSYNNTRNKSKSSNFLLPKKSKNTIIDEDESYSDKTDYNEVNKFIIRNIGFRKSKDSGLTQSIHRTIFKGSIFTRLEIECRHNIMIKLIVVNSHLYFEAGQANTGLEKRKNEFLSLLNEFKLSEYYEAGYNIFFCGDLNFRLTKKLISESNTSQSISNEIIKAFEVNEKKNNELYQNELYKIINEKKNNDNDILKKTLLKKFYINALKFGIHLTCKIHQNLKTEIPKTGKKCYNAESKNGMFNCIHSRSPRIPSMCDKILIAEHSDIHIEESDFSRLEKLRRSDHFMISLSGKFIQNDNYQYIILPKSCVRNNL